MVCPNCGKDIGNSRFCPECGADTSKTAVVKSKSNKKPIFKRWWFWAIIAVFVLACIGSLSNNHSNPVKTHTKEEAKTNDGIVYISVKYTEKYFDILQESIESLENSESSLLDVYSTCEDMRNVLSGFIDRLQEINDSVINSYIESAKNYISNINLIAKEIMDYIDNDDMSKLSSAKEGIALIQSYKTMFLDEREKYLLSCGFTEEEADNLLDEYIHNNSASSTITETGTSSKDDIKEQAQQILEEFYSSEEILSIRPQETKIEVQISSPVLSSQGPPEDWAEIQEHAKSACSQLKSDLGEESFSNYILYLVDPENVNLLSVMGDEVKYDVFGDNDFSVPVDNPGTISLEEFNAIKTGMTYQEVFDIVGSRGEVLSEVDLGLGDEYYTAMYTWDGEGSLGANANVTFQGGKVTSKAQFGLE